MSISAEQKVQPKLLLPQPLHSGALEQVELQPRVAPISYNPGLCSKYNKCISNTAPIKAEEIVDHSFSIPSGLLVDEQPIEIQEQLCVLYRDGYRADLIVEQNLRQHKNKKKQMEKEAQIREDKRRLEQLNKRAAQIRAKTRRRSRSDEKRPAWGHSLYNQKVNQKKEQEKPQQKQPSQIKEAKSKIQIKPVTERIKQYRQKEIKQHEEQMNRIKKKKAQGKKLQLINSQIAKSSQAILKQMKEQKKKLKQSRLTMQAKIRAIEIQSRTSLNKCKKKPVDPTIQFDLNLVEPKAVKKTHKAEQSKPSQQNKAPEKKKYLHVYRPNNPSSKKNSEVSQSQIGQQPQNEAQADAKYNKFFYWDIPILREDYDYIILDKNPELEGAPKPSKKKFREEVNQYLKEKQINRVKSETKLSREQKFNKMVEQKKQQYLEQYKNLEEQSGMGQAFWNEEQVFRGSDLLSY